MKIKDGKSNVDLLNFKINFKTGQCSFTYDSKGAEDLSNKHMDFGALIGQVSCYACDKQEDRKSKELAMNNEFNSIISSLKRFLLKSMIGIKHFKDYKLEE